MNTKKKLLTARINVMMEPKQRKEVAAKAKALKIDMAEAVRRAIHAWCRQQEIQVPE